LQSFYRRPKKKKGTANCGRKKKGIEKKKEGDRFIGAKFIRRNKEEGRGGGGVLMLHRLKKKEKEGA